MAISKGLWVLGVLSLTPVVALASGTVNDASGKSLSVLVQVDAQGKVASVSPASSLPPKFARLLRANLDEMITAPAMDKSGKPISSEFVINVKLQATPRSDGDYDAVFNYLSTIPVPYGAWHWVNVDGRQLALASDAGAGRGVRFHRLERPTPWDREHHPHPSHPNPNQPLPGFRSQSAPTQPRPQSPQT